MLNMDEIIEMAMSESNRLLDESESLMLKFDTNTDLVYELFQRIHTAKSNMLLIPGSNGLSTLLQHFETVLSNFRKENRKIGSDQVDLFLKPIDLSLKFLRRLEAGEPLEDLEKEVYRCMNELRLKTSARKIA